MSISVRKSIRWFPEPASEPTSTLVLTSPRHSYFVDVRALDHALPPSLAVPSAQFAPPSAQPTARRDAAILEWAFAGTSESDVGTDWASPAAGSKDDTAAATSTLEAAESKQERRSSGGSEGDAKKDRQSSAGELERQKAESKRERRISVSVDGHSHHKRRSTERNGERRRKRHARWTHWVDSLADRPEEVVDEADIEDAGSESVERGKMVNPATGEVQAYEEVWRELAVLPTLVSSHSGLGSVHNGSAGSVPTRSGAKTPVEAAPGKWSGRRSPGDSSATSKGNGGASKENGVGSNGPWHIALVLQAENEALGTRGVVVRVGQWCQGMLKSGNEVSCERWLCQGVPKADGRGTGAGLTAGGTAGGAVPAAGADVSSTGGSWECVLSVGTGSLPCQVLWEREDLAQGEEIRSGGLAWRCVERSVWR